MYTKDSLELLKQRIDLVDVVSSSINMSKQGAFYKALCPFHNEKTPSFVIQRGDSHYHCFGCSAHGDAIEFMMSYQKLSFVEAVEALAEKYSVSLERSSKEFKNLGPTKIKLKEVLAYASSFFHFLLLHTKDGHLALEYLYKRGFDLNFIKNFEIGLAPKNAQVLFEAMKKKKYFFEDLEKVGLMKKNSYQKVISFFTDRIMIPIKDAMGSVIGFSARKYLDDTFGPKYINTPETILFKKSKILFGQNYCRKQIAKQRRAIIVEGQFDALRMIDNGFDITVASQGTAFGVDHVLQLLKLGINKVYIAFDSDEAGIEAAVKAGRLFQKKAVDVFVSEFPKFLDPDSFLVEKGPKELTKILKQSKDYLSFLVKTFSKNINTSTPAGKNELIQKISKIIKEGENPLMVHESLKKLARLTNTSESLIGVDRIVSPQSFLRNDKKIKDFDPDQILEEALLKWLLIMGNKKEEFIKIAKLNLKEEFFKNKTSKKMFKEYLDLYDNKQPRDFLSLAITFGEENPILIKILNSKIVKEKAYDNFLKIVEEVLKRDWLEKRQNISTKINDPKISEDEAMTLVKEYDELKNNEPKIIFG